MKEREETFTELMQRAWITPKNYKGYLVEKIVGGYKVLNQVCRNQSEVENVIKKAQDNLSQHIEKQQSIKQ
jgi:hypothetical protein